MSSGTDLLTWLDADRFAVDGVEFVESFLTGSTATRFNIRKNRRLVEQYVSVLQEFRGANIVELGIAQGGSLALLALVASPRKVVAMELSAQRITGLDDLVAQRGLDASVRPYYGVDQADHDRLLEIVEAEFGGAPIDLVIDDASHLLGPTRVSFDTLFPLLRPGGLFLIEDWNWQHKLSHGFDRAASDPDSDEAALLRGRIQAALDEDPEFKQRFASMLREKLEDHGSAAYQQFAAGLDERLEDPEERARFEARMAAIANADGVPVVPREAEGEPSPPSLEEDPLTALVVDLVLARGCSGDIVSEITINEFWAGARRGPATLDPRTFRIGEAYGDPHGLRWTAHP